MTQDIAEIKNEQKWSLKSRILLSVGLPAWVLASFVVSSLIISLVLQMLQSMGVITENSNQSLINTAIAALVYVLTLCIVIGVPFKAKGIITTKEELGLTKSLAWKDILLAPAAFVIYIICAGILIAAVSAFFPDFDAAENQEIGFDNITNYFEYILAFLTLVIIAPVAEELLVRGYLYGKLKKVVPVVAAAIISSLLFSLMHLQWNVAINVLPLALIMVGLREMTGSIWAGILLHMIKNGVAFYLLFINTSILSTMGM